MCSKEKKGFLRRLQKQPSKTHRCCGYNNCRMWSSAAHRLLPDHALRDTVENSIPLLSSNAQTSMDRLKVGIVSGLLRGASISVKSAQRSHSTSMSRVRTFYIGITKRALGSL